MPTLINLETKQEITISEFRDKYLRQVSMREGAQIPFADYNHAVVFDVPPPIHTRLQRVHRLPAVLTDKGTWAQAWEVIDLEKEMTPEEFSAYKESLEAQDAKAESDKAIAQLAALDLKSIRDLREYIASREDAPQFVKDYEAQAVEARAKVIITEKIY
jgi:hypothetical protein